MQCRESWNFELKKVMNGALALFPEKTVVVKQLSLLPDQKVIPANPALLESIDADFEKVGQFGRLANGDCLEYMKIIPTNSVDLIQTDPPYNLGLFMHNRQTNLNKMRENHFAYSGWDDLTFDEWEANMRSFFQESNRVLRKRGSLLMFMSLIKVETLIRLAQEHGFYYKTVGVWHKTNPMPRNMNLHFVNSTECWLYFINEGTTGTFNNANKVIHDYYETSVTPLKEKRFGAHPTQKPIELMNHFVRILSNSGDVVLDPFMGSGSTGVSCEILGRNFLGIELESKYYEITKKRIQNLLT
jgi:site-specific DNA-methyltransferase (adenine-specific)